MPRIHISKKNITPNFGCLRIKIDILSIIRKRKEKLKVKIKHIFVSVIFSSFLSTKTLIYDLMKENKIMATVYKLA